MLAENRKEFIMNLLSEKPFVTVNELSRKLEISEVSVRKLLEKMEQNGLLKRSWGGAVNVSNTLQEYSHKHKSTMNLAEKKAIAKKAYSLINDGEAIFMDSGTTTYELAKQIIAGNKRGLLVCTNALNIAMMFENAPDIHVIVIGGDFRPNILCTTGFLAINALEGLFFDKVFITGNHFSLEYGFSTPIAQETNFKAKLFTVGKESYFLLDYSKYGSNSLYKIAPLSKATAVITDNRANDELKEKFKEIGARLIISE